MAQKEHTFFKYEVSRIRIPFIFREVDIVTAFEDINAKKAIHPGASEHSTLPSTEEKSQGSNKWSFTGAFPVKRLRATVYGTVRKPPYFQ